MRLVNWKYIYADAVGQPESWCRWEWIHSEDSQSRLSNRSELSGICCVGSALIHCQSNLVSWSLKLQRIYNLSSIYSSFKVVFVLTILQFAERSEDQICKICKSWMWLICNQLLNMRAKCWVFVSLCFIHVCSFDLFYCCIYNLYLVAMQWKHLIMIVFHSPF